MDKINRSPLLNDLTMEPTDTGVLHESGQFSMPWTSSQGIPFSFEWMLSVPFPTSRFATVQTITKPTLCNSNFLPLLANLESFDTALSAPKWSCIPFAWATYARRRYELTYIAVKCFTPSRFQFDLSYCTRLQTQDILHRRNYTKELDFTLQRVHTIQVNPLFVCAQKVSSMLINPYNTDNTNIFRVNKADPMLVDAFITFTQTMPVQQGMLYPDTFYVYLFICYSGTVLNTITCPSACSTDINNYVIPRFVAGATVSETFGTMLNYV